MPPRHRRHPAHVYRRRRLGVGVGAVALLALGWTGIDTLTGEETAADPEPVTSSPAVEETTAGADARERRAPAPPEGEGCGIPSELLAATPGAAALGPGMELCADPGRILPPTDLERDEPDRLLTLVSRERAVWPADYAPDDLVTVDGGPYEVRAEVADQLDLLFAAAEEDGHDLTVISGYRSRQTQAGTHQDWVSRVGRERADRISARPGHSEHQLGLAVDVGGACLYACFGDSEDGRWVAEHAHRFGFIVRYPRWGASVTGYDWEPWHLRYVGPRASLWMHRHGEPYLERALPHLG